MEVVDWRNALSGHGEDGYFDLGVFQIRRRSAWAESWYEIHFVPYPSFQRVLETDSDRGERSEFMRRRYGDRSSARCVSQGIALGMLERVQPTEHVPDPIVSGIEKVLREANRKLSKAEILSLTRYTEAQWAQFLQRRPDTIALESHGRGARYWYTGAASAPSPADDTTKAKIPELRMSDYLGQPAVRERLEKFIAGSKQRGEPLDHVLLSGPPGVGKTRLAEIIAGELGRPFHYLWATRVSNLPEALDNIPDGEVVFIDEIHRLSPQQQEQIYEHMRRPITIIGATNFPGDLLPALRDRFSIKETLRLYSPEELSQILLSVQPDLPGPVALEIARRSRGTPRTSLALARRLRDLDGLKPDTVNSAFELLEIDERGLEKRDRDYLKLLETAAGPVGIDTIANSLNESTENVEQIIEPFLLQQGLIVRTKAGRQITDLGLSVVKGSKGKKQTRKPKDASDGQQDLL